MSDDGADRATFDALIDRLADAWARTDASAAAALFTPDATYMEPPDIQRFVGHAELLAYFSPLAPGTYLDIHHRSFDAASGTGAIEFTFGVRGQPTASHGMAVIDVVDGRIAAWREYQVQGPAAFDAFIGTEGKTWRWHIGNYP